MTLHFPRSLMLLLLITAPVEANAEGQSQGDPKLDYMLQCQGCHGADGTGKPEVGIPSMVGLAERFLGAPEGRAYLVQVPGVSQAPLDDRAIANLLNWVLEQFRGEVEGRRDVDTPFSAYTEEEVTSYRTREPIDVAATRARLIERNHRAPARTD